MNKKKDFNNETKETIIEQNQDKVIFHNIDGEEIDYTKDDLIEKITFESANFIRRMCAYFVDLLIIIAIWYFVTDHLFKEADNFISLIGRNESDFTSYELYEQFIGLIIELFIKLFLIWIFIKTIYFTLVPAIIGSGRTIGKWIAGIGVVDIKTLEEVSATRLMLREFIGRGIIETLFIIPMVVSFFISLCRKDSRTIHDFVAKTIVIKLDLYDLS